MTKLIATTSNFAKAPEKGGEVLRNKKYRNKKYRNKKEGWNKSLKRQTCVRT
jgi:hypothetical protein